MHRSIPQGNKICAKRWDSHCRQLHEQRLRNVKPSIDNKPPAQYKHLSSRAKRAQMEEERLRQIERDNRILLEKMSAIMRQKNTLDNQGGQYQPRSLNRPYRKNEMMRITKENLAMVKRIQQKEPFYNHLQWVEHQRDHENYLKNIGEYPYVLTDKQGSGQKSRPATRPTTTGTQAQANGGSGSDAYDDSELDSDAI